MTSKSHQIEHRRADESSAITSKPLHLGVQVTAWVPRSDIIGPPRAELLGGSGGGPAGRWELRPLLPASLATPETFLMPSSHSSAQPRIHGTLLEVRRRLTPDGVETIAFVRFRDEQDGRMGAWLPLSALTHRTSASAQPSPEVREWQQSGAVHGFVSRVPFEPVITKAAGIAYTEYVLAGGAPYPLLDDYKGLQPPHLLHLAAERYMATCKALAFAESHPSLLNAPTTGINRDQTAGSTSDAANKRDGMTIMDLFEARLVRDIHCAPQQGFFYFYLSTYPVTPASSPLPECVTRTALGDVTCDGYAMRPWYFSPVLLLHGGELQRGPYSYYPWLAESNNCRIGDWFICPFTLRFCSSARQLNHYLFKLLTLRAARNAALTSLPSLPALTSTVVLSPRYPLCPPGREIYADRASGVSVFELAGRSHIPYCRNMFLLAKSFLENKLCGHDVGLYIFYVVALHAEVHYPRYQQYVDALAARVAALGGGPAGDTTAYVFAGFFSWEIGSDPAHNLACILSLPCFGTERDLPTSTKGLGKFLISLSYNMAYRRGFIGSPERPLSDLGERAYASFWRTVVLSWLASHLQLDAPDSSSATPSLNTVETSGRGKGKGLVMGMRRRRTSARDSTAVTKSSKDALGAFLDKALEEEALIESVASSSVADDNLEEHIRGLLRWRPIPQDNKERSIIVTAEEIAEGCGLLPADCLSALKEIGVFHCASILAYQAAQAGSPTHVPEEALVVKGSASRDSRIILLPTPFIRQWREQQLLRRVRDVRSTRVRLEHLEHRKKLLRTDANAAKPLSALPEQIHFRPSCMIDFTPMT